MKTDLVSKSDIWELVGEMAETVRPGSKLEGVMKRYVNAIDNAPTIDAIPVEWLEKQCNTYDLFISSALRETLRAWKIEKEMQNGIRNGRVYH